MFFIIPKNYNLKPKLLGLFDYSTAVLNIIIFLITFFLLYFLIILKLKYFLLLPFIFQFSYLA